MRTYPVQVLFREYFEGIVAAVLLALFLRFFVVSILYIPTENMEPGLKRGDFVMGWRLAYGLPLPLSQGERLNAKAPQRGEVISFRFPGDEEQIIIRRVVATSGDRIEIVAGAVHINGTAFDQSELEDGSVLETPMGAEEGYPILPNGEASLGSIEVPDGHIFVLSDNRMTTDDSRDWGTVPVKNIESRLGMTWLSVSNTSGGLSVRWARIFDWVR